MNGLRFLRNSGVWLAAALVLPVAYASDPANAGNSGIAAVRNAIANAEQALDAARAQNALWTSAEDALRRAERAIAAGDEAAALEHAQFAAGQAQLGLAQKQYPLTR